jgi:parvulin-like peptidyl-prolyl isomerase
MAKKKEQQKIYLSSKKHIARKEKERREIRAIIFATIAVVVITIVLVSIPLIRQYFIFPRQPVASVNQENISTQDWQTQTKFYRYNIIKRIENSLQLAQLFGNNPSYAASITGQIQSLVGQLDPTTAGKATLDQMIDDELIRQEAEQRGITVTDEEIEQGIQEAFGYYANGTPTPTVTLEPKATSTLTPLQMTLIPPTSTPTQTSTPDASNPTNTPTATFAPTSIPSPTASPTPYTFEEYQKNSQDIISTISQTYGITEDELKEGIRYAIKAQLLREKLQEEMLSDVSCTEKQVWARHILVEDEQTAQEISKKLSEGEDFCTLAAEYSIDTSNKDNCGDLGWFSLGTMVKEFEEAAFELQTGEISEPIQTQFGYHIIQSLGKENRQLTPSQCDQKKEKAFNDWLSGARTLADIEIFDYWKERVPVEPTIPLETQRAIQNILQPVITPTAQP